MSKKVIGHKPNTQSSYTPYVSEFNFDACDMIKGITPLTKRGEKAKAPVTNPKIYYHPTAKAEIDYLVKVAPKEVGWLGTVREMDDGYMIEEIFIPEQTVSSAETDIDDNAMMTLGNELMERDICPSKLIYWGHSHVNMGVTPSGQDERQIDEFLTDSPVFIRGIYNKRGDSKVDVFDTNQGVVFQCCDEETLILTSSKEKIDLAMKENVHERTYQVAYQNRYGGNPYGHNFGGGYKTQPQQTPNEPIDLSVIYADMGFGYE